MDKDVLIEVLSEMFARSALNRQRKKCECERPMPGVFDDMDFTTCQKCGCLLSRVVVVERQLN